MTLSKCDPLQAQPLAWGANRLAISLMWSLVLVTMATTTAGHWGRALLTHLWSPNEDSLSLDAVRVGLQGFPEAWLCWSLLCDLRAEYTLSVPCLCQL